eukprot:1161692-Pelagomonas_calceolata.AAC.5
MASTHSSASAPFMRPVAGKHKHANEEVRTQSCRHVHLCVVLLGAACVAWMVSVVLEEGLSRSENVAWESVA